MKAIDIIKLSTRMFKARPSRTILTVLGMSVGIGAILFLVSLGYGLQKTLLEKITTADSLLTLDVSEARSGLVNLDHGLVDEIRHMDGVVETSASFRISSQGHMNDISADLAVNAVEPSFLRLGGYKMKQGKSISDDNQEGIIINSSVAQVFGKTVDDIIGQEITFTFFIPEGVEKAGTQEKFRKVESQSKYKIVGVIEGEDNAAFVHAKTLDFLDIKKFNALKVRCLNDNIMKAIRDKVIEMGLLVSSLSDIVEQANQVFSVIQIVLMLFGVVALIVSAIGMFNTMTIALLERTEEIGIMKSIGASNMAVSLMFVTEATIMGFLGGLGGVVMGYLGGEIFNISINLVARRFGGEPVDLFYSPPEFVLGIIIFAAVVGFFTGVVPARRASSIDPLDALRYK
ncbi:MAG: cell division protein FtsX [uncultured bacterium]|nr:MAG: cell division protein FtsX [uncultured bacterium]HCU70148.1 hypothetical protein [Candidatus Moranbacteria bacterium]